MARGQLAAVLQRISSLTDNSDLTDGQLLEQFIARGEESAFESLVKRHGGLVLQVCRRVLNDGHMAEDCFQATFLVLVRKAGTIRRHQSVSSWLYGVAYRVAMKARMRGARRHLFERELVEEPGAEMPEEKRFDEELRPILDEELVHLSEKFRAPLVLCYLQGKTYKEAAKELGWSEGSMSRRLAQARERLRRRLVQRGVGLSVAGLSTVLTQVAKAAVPPVLLQSTLKAAALLPVSAAVSSAPAALAQAYLQEVSFFIQLKIAASLLLAVGLGTVAVGISAIGTIPEQPSAVAAVETTEGNPFFFAGGTDVTRDDPLEPAIEEPEDGPEMEMEEPTPPDLPAIPEVQLPEPLRLAIKRRNKLGEEELRRQLRRMPEVGLDGDATQKTTHYLGQQAMLTPADQLLHLVPGLLASRTDWMGLPVRQPPNCQLEDDPAQTLRARSRELRMVIGETLSHNTDPRLLPETLRLNFQKGRDFKDNFGNDCAVPTLMQLLAAEDTQVRRVLIEQLGRIENSSASEALARLALFDISPEVRAEAVQALSQRPSYQYVHLLLEGFRYPWAPVADHAAEALITLEHREAVPQLKQMLDQPDPAGPFFDEKRGGYVVREVVRVNHLRNCLMRHAPAPDRKAVVLAQVPVPGKPLPPMSARYYDPDGGVFVRAEVIYLRQDFSVAQPVAKADPWPTQQRFDYLVRTKPAADPAGQQRPTYPQREALLHAIRELEK